MKFLSVIAFIAIFFAACDDMKQPIMDIAGEMGIAEEEAIPEETEISEAIPEEIAEEEMITEEVHPDDEELITLVPFYIDGVEHHQVVFLNSDAALNSKKFQDAIVYAMDYNDQNCGKLEKQGRGYNAPIDYSFLTEDEANVFSTHAIDNYEEFGGSGIFESIDLWHVTLHPRCY